MPHDRNGQLLAKGDSVAMTFTVTEITSQGEALCNVQLQALRPVAFEESHLPIVSCNSKLVEKIDATPRALPREEWPTGGQSPNDIVPVPAIESGEATRP